MSDAVYELGVGLPAAASADGRRGGHAATVRVLGLDPDLGAGIAPEQRAAAASRAETRVLALDHGPWLFHPLEPAGLGRLILEGLILVRVEYAGVRAHAELLGEGDVISPWQGM